MLKISIYTLLLAGSCGLASMAIKKDNGDCRIYGSVSSRAGGENISAASIGLYKKDSLVSTVITDQNGAFCIKNINAGVYRIRVNQMGYAPQVSQALRYNGKPLKVDVVLTPNLALEDVQVQLSPRGEADQTQRIYEQNIKGTHTTRREAKKNWCCPSPKDKYSSQDAEMNTENYAKINDNGFKESRRNPLSTFSIDVDKASYSNVRRFLTQGQLPPADAVRIEEMINYFSYDYPQPRNEHPFSISTSYLDCPWNKKHKLVHIGIQGKEIKTEQLPPNNLVFLLDVSGSMEDPNKLPLLKSGLRLLIDQMRPEDKVAIVVYAGAAGVVLPSTSGKEKEKITEALDNLQAGGSTAGGDGILLAYKTARAGFLKEGNNRIILATDGDFNVGVSSDGELVRLIEKQREDGIFLTVLGFGTGNYKDTKMEQLADKGNGNYAYIDNLLEAKKTLVREMGGTLLTIAKDVKIQVEFNPAKIKGYRLVGYENRVLNNEDFNDDKKDAGELGAGHTVTALYEVIPADSDEALASVDTLKYQPNHSIPKHGGDEIMTIKFRYKSPKDTVSKLISVVLQDKKTPFLIASEDARFAAAVAEFGMLLRDSKYKGESDYKHVLSMARSSKGKDENGYRAEFIRLVETAELLSAR